MKRIAILALPMLATIVAVGIGLLLFRSQGAALGSRIGAAKESVAEALDEATQAVMEAVE